MQPRNTTENLLGVALIAIGRGAKGVRIDLPAIELIRSRFESKIRSAVADPLWRRKWDAERAYVLVQAEAMGQCAARLAAEERRAVITATDVELAMMKLRGRLPVAGRWCPF
jgi:hypothetical protein